MNVIACFISLSNWILYFAIPGLILTSYFPILLNCPWIQFNNTYKKELTQLRLQIDNILGGIEQNLLTHSSTKSSSIHSIVRSNIVGENNLEEFDLEFIPLPPKNKVQIAAQVKNSPLGGGASSSVINP